jgi:hypothetical protein
MGFFRVESYSSGLKISLGSFDIEARNLHGREAGSKSLYMSQLILGSLRFHVFWRGDEDPDPHDHPWEFWTFPLTDYLEEVTDPETHEKHTEIVTAFHWHHRPATYTHRVLRRVRNDLHGWDFWTTYPGPIVTIVWTGPRTRSWGFLKTRDGKWCWVAWREYVFKGGKDAPCE